MKRVFQSRNVEGNSFFFHRKLRPVKEKASGQMRSSQRRILLARGTKVVLPKQWLSECTKYTFVNSQEIASCERKSLRHRKLRPVKAGQGAVYRRISLYLYWDTDI